MLRLFFAVVTIMLFSFPVFASDTRPSEKSIQELLAVTEAGKLLDNVMKQMDMMMKSSMREALQGQEISEKQQKTMDAMQAKTMKLLQEELSWKNLEPLYIKVYGDSFTQDEVDGMLAFYRTPAGRALIGKMPLVLQNTMTELQKQMGPLARKLQKLQQETIAELQAQSGG